jgi:hypothetical protein
MNCRSLSMVLFDRSSRVREISGWGFSDTALCGIVIPASVIILCHGCFAHCRSLRLFAFESVPRLERIEAEAFLETELSVLHFNGQR